VANGSGLLLDDLEGGHDGIDADANDVRADDGEAGGGGGVRGSMAAAVLQRIQAGTHCVYGRTMDASLAPEITVTEDGIPFTEFGTLLFGHQSEACAFTPLAKVTIVTREDAAYRGQRAAAVVRFDYDVRNMCDQVVARVFSFVMPTFPCFDTSAL
jgi:hypothetical protein